MASRKQVSSLLLANFLIPISILVFARGFFPYKPFLSGLATYEPMSWGPPPESPFNKVVFMVVDALRSDFVYSDQSGFSFTQSLISDGAAIPFTAHATSPTITMPRIKAITTGSIPSFLDVILNFAESDTTSSLASQDTWLAQMKEKWKSKWARKLVMYGDDTWLKLFPGTFHRSDGTSSFFVSDFTEVDNNVTRHVPEELNNDDWNTLVLHYLGLDHIGHKAGPKSPNMIPKQREMDSIVKQVYEAMETKQKLQSTLLVLLGDHGMNDAGNHGGSAPGETSPALVFISPKLKSITSGGYKAPAPFQENYQYYSTVEQSDIAPTLAGLLGFPIPQNNLGAFIPKFLDFFPKKSDRIQLLMRNARQMMKVVVATFPEFNKAGVGEDCEAFLSSLNKVACGWREIVKGVADWKEEEDPEPWLKAMNKWLKQAQQLMSSTASNYDTSKLVEGQALGFSALVAATVAASSTILVSVKNCYPIMLIGLLYGIMMFSSSYVEEEQHFWYWTSTAWVGLLWIRSARKGRLTPRLLAMSSLIVLVSMRLARRWNQTGQKFAGEPDIARTFFSSHRLTLWTLVALTYLWNIQSLTTKGFSRFPQLAAGAIATTLATASITFKLAFTNEDSPELLAGPAKSMAATDSELGLSLITRARIAFMAIGLSLLYTLASSFGHSKRPNPTMHTLHDLLTLLLITQSRATNIPLLLLLEIQFYTLKDLDLSLVELTTTSLLMQYTSFFAFGGSNAISSIDLSSAYNGVSGYNVLAVGILTFVSNWAGPIFWTSATNLMLLRLKRKGGNDLLLPHLALLTMFVAGSLFFVMAACTVLRTHLFIWTVFSPKYLYSMAWSLGQHLAINMSFGSLLYWIGSKYL
ncbi:GPI ethanolamine phosphate transferas-like protein 2 [Hyaloscypha variabilis F]|uniref:GPI ethanolamine phosphate transferase 2 n=1 Tax=Hyaloscypha variabilis (strain UAMH 11265 / GT02V1 / F) TaxID=1149755 RepID=A0A2J6RXM2_HYAVF|nr:GPI ethanolamine phosphate transferas-like protein 2 [Hyaloscypha variabilis F]